MPLTHTLTAPLSHIVIAHSFTNVLIASLTRAQGMTTMATRYLLQALYAQIVNVCTSECLIAYDLRLYTSRRWLACPFV